MNREALRNQAAGRRNHVEPILEKRRVKWTCDFCQHDFASERTFMNHRCKERDRIEELRGPIGQAAYSYYSDWMRLNKRSVPPIETFASSSYYSTFIKFANHVRRVSMPNPPGFVRAMVENGNVQPSLWCRDNVYALYLQGYDKVVEPAQQFMDSVELMHSLAMDYGVPVHEVYDALGVEKMLSLVQKRKLSPWFLVASKKFHAFLKQQNEIDQGRLEAAVQVGAMIMRIKQNADTIELFKLFSENTKLDGL